MRRPSHRVKHFTEQELEELINIIQAKWQSGDPIIRKFVNKVGKLQKKRETKNRIRCFEELIIKLIAEYIKRITIPWS